MKIHYLILTLIPCFSTFAYSALVLDFSGVSGSNIVNYTASGSVTVTQSYSADTITTTAEAPVGGVWSPQFDNEIGEVLTFTDGSTNDDLDFSSTISFQKNGVEFGTFDRIDLDPDGIIDDIELNFTTSESGNAIPSLVAGDIISWTGSGTFTLESGTYDTEFIPGSFSNVIDGGSYTVNVAAVPEPSSISLIALAGIGSCMRRRRE